MEDIEDMFKNDDLDNKRLVIKNKVRRNNKPQPVEEPDGVVIKGTSNAENNNEVISNNEAALPGKQKIFVKTYGCSHNISDSEYMAGLLTEYGFQLVEKMEEADACLLNSCTVKNPSQEKFIK